jgi:PncC family amidohydrolase
MGNPLFLTPFACCIITCVMDDSLETQVGELLRRRGLRLAVAESCTGGLLAHRLTNVPGSSTYFVGGIISYAYEAKVRLLGVSWETLEKYGAVSRETVLEMAHGARRMLSADIGLSVSGIAGPGGGMPEKPVGLAWFGLSARDFEDARSTLSEGDRLNNKEHFADTALKMLIEYLSNGSPSSR